MCSLFSVLLQLQDAGLGEGWKDIDWMGSPCSSLWPRQPRHEEASKEPQHSTVTDEAFAFHDLEGRSFRQGAVADIVREAHYDANQCARRNGF